MCFNFQSLNIDHYHHHWKGIFFLRKNALTSVLKAKLRNIIRNAQSLENIATRWWCGGTLCQHRMALMCPLCPCSPSLSKQNVCSTAADILISAMIDNEWLCVLINLEHETAMNASWYHSLYLIECLLLSIFSNQNVYSQCGSWKLLLQFIIELPN